MNTIKILAIILLFSVAACNSVKRNVVRSTVNDTTIKAGITDSSSFTKTVTNEAKHEQKDQTDYEVETSSNEFPANADTTMEIVKIAKSLPKGSKVRIVHNAGKVVTETKIVQRDSNIKHIDTGSVKVHEEKTIDIHKESKRVPWLMVLMGGIIALVAVVFVIYKKTNKL